MTSMIDTGEIAAAASRDAGSGIRRAAALGDGRMLEPHPLAGDAGAPATRPPVPRLRTLRWVVSRAVAVLLLEALFLLSPAIPEGERAAAWVDYVAIHGRLGFHLNRDSAAFMLCAESLAKLASPICAFRQSRPTYVLAGHGLHSLLGGLGAAVGARLRPPVAPSWLAFVLLNYLCVLLALLLFERFVGGARRPPLCGAVIGWLLVVSWLSRPFFWTPHTQMLNLLAPVAALALWSWSEQVRGISLLGWAGVGTALGVAFLGYGAFAVPLGAVAAGMWLGPAAAPAGGHGWRSRASWTAALAAGFLWPTLAWIAFLRTRGIVFTSPETASYRQFVWIADVARLGAGPLAAILLAKLTQLAWLAVSVLRLPVAMLGALAALAWSAREHRPRRGRGHLLRWRAVAGVFLLEVVFLYLMGYYQERLAWALVPPVLAGAAIVAGDLDARLAGGRRLAFRLALIAVVGLQVAHCVAAPWPHFGAAPAAARAAARARS